MGYDQKGLNPCRLKRVLKVASWTWPSYFPDDCPPERAFPSEGDYYRIVKTDPPTQGDYVSLYDLDRTRAERTVTNGQRTVCETMGLSVYASRDQAIQCARQYPKLGNQIARIALRPVAGRMLETGGYLDSHHTWWKAVGFNPIRDSQVVASV